MKLDQPTPVDKLTLAFPANVSHLMPQMSEIPAQFRDPNSRTKWITFQRDWFYGGISTSKLVPKKDIDLQAVLRHLSVIQGSYEPKHEHKEAAVAYLASLWLDESSTWERIKK
jgi:hypothetical protein